MGAACRGVNSRSSALLHLDFEALTASAFRVLALRPQPSCLSVSRCLYLSLRLSPRKRRSQLNYPGSVLSHLEGNAEATSSAPRLGSEQRKPTRPRRSGFPQTPELPGVLSRRRHRRLPRALPNLVRKLQQMEGARPGGRGVGARRVEAEAGFLKDCLLSFGDMSATGDPLLVPAAARTVSQTAPRRRAMHEGARRGAILSGLGAPSSKCSASSPKALFADFF